MRGTAPKSGRPATACPVFHSRPTAAAIGLIAVLAAPGARAAPPENADPALAPWFQSLQAPNGSSCCSIADCRMTDYRTNKSGYEALIEGRWMTVPRDRVLDRVSNPTGRAVVCYLPGMGILCFVRPAES
jgi:hypothetical protein